MTASTMRSCVRRTIYVIVHFYDNFKNEQLTFLFIAKITQRTWPSRRASIPHLGVHLSIGKFFLCSGCSSYIIYTAMVEKNHGMLHSGRWRHFRSFSQSDIFETLEWRNLAFRWIVPFFADKEFSTIKIRFCGYRNWPIYWNCIIHALVLQRTLSDIYLKSTDAYGTTMGVVLRRN